ncbi:MAG: hypothetical protein QOJ24_1394 [Mycobacterium sp.]|jgi:hypothetical protein|nr:hypothetical protein [Mycobacterium sp.]
MVPALGAFFAVAAATTGLAAPAAADTTSYLQSVQPTYAFMSESQLLSAGHQACASARSGIPASDNTIKVSKDMGISTSAAYNIVVNSINHLGC